MKIGIMSMQRIINYGSFLQAYALSNIIKNLGHTVEFVDFKIDPCIVKPYTPTQEKDVPKEYINYFYELKKFEEIFKTEYLKELGISKRNERPQLDTLIIGSDEVFNCLQDNSDVGYSLELFGKNNNAKKLITYAASCGSTTVDGIKKHNKETEISELLNKFDCISVRDDNTKTFIESLSNIKPSKHLDPVLIYDFSHVTRNNVKLKDYIIVYSYSFNISAEESLHIKKFAKKHNKKIVSIGTYQTCADIYIHAHPLEVLPYFQKADFVITNTFHGSIFSIKSHTPFVTLTKNYNYQKLTSLLSDLKLSDRIISSINELDIAYSKRIDFSISDNIMENEKLRSIEYLKNSI